MLLVVAFLLLVVSKPASEPSRTIHCWLPVEFPRGWSDYSEDICNRKNAVLSWLRPQDVPGSKFANDSDLVRNVAPLIIIYSKFIHSFKIAVLIKATFIALIRCLKAKICLFVKYFRVGL